MDQPLQMDDTSSISRREEEPVRRRCRRRRRRLSLIECSYWHTLVFIMGVLTLLLGLILIIYRSYRQVAFSIGICMIVASLTVIVLSRVQVSSNNNENWSEGQIESERTNSSSSSSQTLVFTSTRL